MAFLRSLCIEKHQGMEFSLEGMEKKEESVEMLLTIGI